MKTLISLLFVVALSNSNAWAEKAPLSLERLTDQASVIVVATIEQIRVETEPSFFERAPGNSDWGIYLTLNVHSVEKGSVIEERIEARCFRIKSRNSMMEYYTPSGHHPIPTIGTRVRVYLEMKDDLWHVLLPNGITSVDNVSVPPGRNLQDAPEVKRLLNNAGDLSGRLGYTYLFPYEIWILLVCLGIPTLLVGIFFVRRIKKSRSASHDLDETT